MTFDQFLQLVDTLKWPSCALIAVALILVSFRTNIAGFFDRLKSIGKDGLHAHPITKPELQTKEVEQKTSKQQIQELLQPLNSPVIVEKEAALRADLKQRNLPFEGDSIDILITFLAQTQLALLFEQIYRLIFGSQIYLLKQVNEKGGLTEKDIGEHFQHVKKLFEPTFNDWTVEEYMKFPLSRVLLTKTGSTYYITNLGLDFLSWIIRRSYPEQKNL